MKIPALGATVTWELATSFASAALTAIIVTLAGVGRTAGAVYKPDPLILPTVEFPPAIPLTSQVTNRFVVPVTVAENCCVASTITLALEGVTCTLKPGGVVTAFDGSRLQPVNPRAVAIVSRSGIQRVFIINFLRPMIPSSSTLNPERSNPCSGKTWDECGSTVVVKT